MVSFVVKRETLSFGFSDMIPEANHSVSSVSVVSITVLRRRMFSRRAPMQPQNVMKNMTTPTTIKMTAGSMRNVSRTVSGGHEHNSPRSDV